MIKSNELIVFWVGFTKELLFNSLKIIREVFKSIRSAIAVIHVTNVIMSVGAGATKFWIGIKSHFKNCCFDSNTNNITLPNEKISDFFSFFSKHSGLAKTGVPPCDSGPAIPKSVKAISIFVKSFGPLLNFTKKFWGLISLCVWSWRSSVSRLWKFFKFRGSGEESLLIPYSKQKFRYGL